MSLENIALGSLGAKVVGHSSSSDQHSYPPSNVLSEKEEEIWNSAEGLPQSITVSLEDVRVKYSHIARLGFYCWHDYTTNPKTVEVEVGLPESDKLVLWCKLTLKHQSGRQFFAIQPLPASYRIIKFTITETFGDYETYLNQIYIEAQVEESQLNSMMGLNDLDSPLRKSQNRQKGYKDHKYLKDYRPKQAYNHKEEYSQEEDPEFVENTFHNKQNYSASKPSYSKHSSKFSEEEAEEEVQDRSYQNDIALLTLSKNVMEMEENIEEIKRSLEVLSMRIDVTYEKLEERMVARIDEVIEKKMEKLRHELKSELKRSSQLRESKSQHENFKSKELRMADFQEQREPERNTVSIREGKQSLHIHNLKSNRAERESSKDLIVGDLMDKLAKKLKERELKIKKIESKREKEKTSCNNRSGLHRDPYP